jgi:hypothetical protein
MSFLSFASAMIKALSKLTGLGVPETQYVV